PYLAAPLANTLLGWIAISWGIVPVFETGLPWTMPILFSGTLGTGSFMGGVLQVVWLVMDIFIYAPFVITANMLDFKDEEGEGR
ncbi:MAG: PTS sugar transporter subunit IIC, partial [Selenomonadaceae bacterium]|nr:PTS sugar transporter subunit IIC [Selenomonadaceae bacterium]